MVAAMAVSVDRRWSPVIHVQEQFHVCVWGRRESNLPIPKVPMLWFISPFITVICNRKINNIDSLTFSKLFEVEVQSIVRYVRSWLVFFDF